MISHEFNRKICAWCFTFGAETLLLYKFLLLNNTKTSILFIIASLFLVSPLPNLVKEPLIDMIWNTYMNDQIDVSL